MKFFKVVANNFYKIMLPIVALCIAVCMVFLVTRDNIFPHEKLELVNPYLFEGDVDVLFEDGTEYRKKAPLVITTDKNFRVTLNLDDIGMIDDKTLSFISKNVTIRCEVDDKVIYRNFRAINQSKYAESNILFLVDLPKNIIKNKITIFFENNRDYQATFELKDIKIGKRINIVSSYFLSKSVLEYILLVFMAIIFISIISTTNFMKKLSPIEKYFNYIGVLSFDIFVYVASTMSLSYFVLSQYTTILYICSYTSLMLMPIIMLNAITLRTSKKVNQLLKFSIILTSFNAIAQYILVFLDFKTFTMMANYTYLIILFSMILIVYAFVDTNKTDENRIYTMIFSILPLIIGITYESLSNMTQGYITFSVVFKVCILIFAAAQCYEFFSFYISDRDKKVTAELYKKLAFIDRLTDVGNRLALSEKRIDYDKAKRSFYVILMDINNLKYVNDTYGHKYGDSIIKLLSDIIKEELDQYDKDLFRIGGDEFVIVYHAPKDTDIQVQLASLVDRYENTQIDGIEKDSFGVSYGFSYCDIQNGDDFGKEMHIADQNMYRNKAAKKSVVNYKSVR